MRWFLIGALVVAAGCLETPLRADEGLEFHGNTPALADEKMQEIQAEERAASDLDGVHERLEESYR